MQGVDCWFVAIPSVFPLKSRFIEDLFEKTKKRIPHPPTNQCMSTSTRLFPTPRVGALQQNRTLRELTFSGDVDDMTILASTLKVNTTLQRIESKGDLFTGHLEGGGKARETCVCVCVCVYCQNNRGQQVALVKYSRISVAWSLGR